jgi:hypothetical protein
MTKRSLAAVAIGAALLVAAVAGFVVVPEHKPIPPQCAHGQDYLCPEPTPPGAYVAHGLSKGAYDALRIGTWALVILGVIVVGLGLSVTRGLGRWRASTLFPPISRLDGRPPGRSSSFRWC